LEREGIKNKTDLMKDIHSLIRQTIEAADLNISATDKRCF
jgi:hypothetical protein